MRWHVMRDYVQSIIRHPIYSGINFVVFGMIGLAVLSFVFTPHPTLPAWRYYGTLLGLSALTAVYLIPDGLDYGDRARHVAPTTLASLLATLALTLIINYLGLDSTVSFLPFLIFLLVGHATSVLAFPFALLYAVVAIALFMVVTGGNETLTTIVARSTSLLTGAAFTMVFTTLAVRSREESIRTEGLLEQLQIANTALRAAQEQEKVLAATEERVRLAREIHDGLGHHLTVLAVQLQAAERLIQNHPDRAAQAIQTCREVAQAALKDVRYSVATLHHSPLDGRTVEQAIEKMVETLSIAPRAVYFDTKGKKFALSPAAALTLYRTAQEGLTNAQKHSDSAVILIRLHYNADDVTLTVLNDGSPVTSVSPGIGLLGVQARAAQLGGTWRGAPHPDGGFILEVSLPARGIAMIRIVLADDQQLIRQGIQILLELESDMQVVAHATNGREAVALTRQHQPDVVLMDVRMPELDGVAATRQIQADMPQVGVIILTGFDDDEYVFEGLKAGARGYLLKAVSSEALTAAVRTVARGEALIQPSIARKVVDEFSRLASRSAPDTPLSPTLQPLIEPLTERELEVLRELARGLSNREIAERLIITEGTVKNHISNLLGKLDVRDRMQAVLKGQGLGLI